MTAASGLHRAGGAVVSAALRGDVLARIAELEERADSFDLPGALWADHYPNEAAELDSLLATRTYREFREQTP